jgi:hypothetical protein
MQKLPILIIQLSLGLLTFFPNHTFADASAVRALLVERVTQYLLRSGTVSQDLLSARSTRLALETSLGRSIEAADETLLRRIQVLDDLPNPHLAANPELDAIADTLYRRVESQLQETLHVRSSIREVPVLAREATNAATQAEAARNRAVQAAASAETSRAGDEIQRLVDTLPRTRAAAARDAEAAVTESNRSWLQETVNCREDVRQSDPEAYRRLSRSSFWGDLFVNQTVDISARVVAVGGLPPERANFLGELGYGLLWSFLSTHINNSQGSFVTRWTKNMVMRTGRLAGEAFFFSVYPNIETGGESRTEFVRNRAAFNMGWNVPMSPVNLAIGDLLRGMDCRMRNETTWVRWTPTALKLAWNAGTSYFYFIYRTNMTGH